MHARGCDLNNDQTDRRPTLSNSLSVDSQCWKVNMRTCTRRRAVTPCHGKNRGLGFWLRVVWGAIREHDTRAHRSPGSEIKEGKRTEEKEEKRQMAVQREGKSEGKKVQIGEERIRKILREKNAEWWIKRNDNDDKKHNNQSSFPFLPVRLLPAETPLLSHTSLELVPSPVLKYEL